MDTTPEPYQAPGAQFKRAYRACVHCRRRKIRCDLGDIDNPSKPPCVRCRRENRECILATSKRGGIGNVRSGKEKRMMMDQGIGGIYLSNGAQREYSPVSDGALDPTNPVKIESNNALPGHISTRELHNTSDALDILAHAARNFPRMRRGGAQGPSFPSSGPLMVTKPGSHDDKERESQNYEPETRPEDLEIVRFLNLPVSEVHLLVRYFFSSLHPFYPYIPAELHSVNRLADMPFLLTAILTLASRYYQPEADLSSPGTPKDANHYSELHVKLWDYCQTLFSKSVWAEASSRSIGTVFAFLLFSEWNPRAIHVRGSDYANRGENIPQAQLKNDGVALSAFRRSDRMAWMLIGNGIRLAQDMDLFETNPKVYLATHLSETVLALRLGRRSMLGEFLREQNMRFLNFTEEEQAKLELLRIMSLAHETLYSSRNTTRELTKDGKYLSFLGLFTPHLDAWEQKYTKLLLSSGLERESLLFDYHYTRLYIYSVALSANDDAPGSLSNISGARYVGAATDAARELLACAQRVHDDNRNLRRAPIRWLVRIVHAAVFLLKSVLLMPASSFDTYQKQTVQLIRDTSRTLIDASPDDVHLAARYGKILLAISSQVTVSEEAQDSDIQDLHGSMLRQVDHNQVSDSDERGSALTTRETSGVPTNQAVYDDGNILGMMDMDFDFFMEGSEGLGFVEPFMEGVEQQEWFKQSAN